MKNIYFLMTIVVTLAIGFGLNGCERSTVTPVVGMDALSTFSVDKVNGQPATMCTELLAGQTIPAGTVCFEVVGNTINVTYTTTGGWELTEAHLWMGCNVSGYPQTKSGNPKIGNFPYNSGNITGSTSYTFSVSLDQFPCLASIDCENGNVLYAMAHAAVRKPKGDGTYQTETGWGNGNDTPGANWATIVTLTLFDDSCGGGPNKCWGGDETAFAFDGDQNGCFQNFPDYLDNPKRWGWTNGPYGPGTYTWDLYAGAGLCDTSKGTIVGSVTLVYDGSTATVTYTTVSTWILDVTHVYVGNEMFARDNKGDFTLAPGQYGSENDFVISDQVHTSTHVFTGLSGEIYAVIHAGVLTEVPCE